MSDKTETPTQSIFVEDGLESLRLAKNSTRDFVVVDENVLNHHSDLEGWSSSSERIAVIKCDEQSKNLHTLHAISSRISKFSPKDDSRLIGVGGGVCMDLVGFLAATQYCKINAWIAFPSTIIAQSDCCFGEFISLNVGNRKGVLGIQFPPEEINICLQFLSTLSAESVGSGLGKLSQLAFIESVQTFDAYRTAFGGLTLDSSNLKEWIKRCIIVRRNRYSSTKYGAVSEDPRMYGYAFAHAIESSSRYKIAHGNAVAIGMDLSNYISMLKGYISREDWADYRESFRVVIGEGKIVLKSKTFLDTLSLSDSCEDGILSLLLTHGPGQFSEFSLELTIEVPDALDSYLCALG